MSEKKQALIEITSTIIAASIIVLLLVALFIGGRWYERLQLPNAIRISKVAVEEIMFRCDGAYQDLAANREYVYANCLRQSGELKPVTVQNYIFK